MFLQKYLERVLANTGMLTARFFPRKIILGYHSLCSNNREGDTSSKGFVGKRRILKIDKLESQLKWLSGFSDFVSLDQLFRNDKRDRANRWQVAVTFDDGYRDNITLGLPLFDSYKVPVTWFVSTRFVENLSQLPWWDFLDFIEERWQEVIEFEFNGSYFRYDLRQLSDTSMFRKKLIEIFMLTNSQDREAFQRQLEEIVRKKLPLPKNGFASMEEVVEAARSPWISLGGHTHSHINMAQCREDEMIKELIDGREKLQQWTGQDVGWYAYPYGGRNNFNDLSVKSVRRAGFCGAVTTVQGYVNHNVDQYRIPRVLVNSMWDLIALQSRVLNANVCQITQDALCKRSIVCK